MQFPIKADTCECPENSISVLRSTFPAIAVKVVIEGVQVGYIAKFDSAAVTKMIEKSGKKSYEVPAKIGFDAESPAPLIGVKIALTVE
jgi:hypothetical protein